MKVSEAKEKVCPFSINQSITNVNDMEQIVHTNSNCICGACMAWVTAIKYHQGVTEEYIENHSPDDNGNTHSVRIRPKELDDDDKEGYCIRLEMR